MALVGAARWVRARMIIGMQMFNELGRRGAALANWLTRPANVQQRNVRNVLIDGIGVALVQGVATFLSVFLVRLGATPFMVGLLTSMPALTGMILAIPVGRLLERAGQPVPEDPDAVGFQLHHGPRLQAQPQVEGASAGKGPGADDVPRIEAL